MEKDRIRERVESFWAVHQNQDAPSCSPYPVELSLDDQSPVNMSCMTEH